MVKRRRRSSLNKKLIGTVVGVSLIGATSGIIAGSGTTGATRAVLDVVPAAASVKLLKKWL